VNDNLSEENADAATSNQPAASPAVAACLPEFAERFVCFA
jgi:hypothetical protein